VGFDRHQVAVRCDAPDVRAVVEGYFRHLIRDAAGEPISSLETGFADGAYYLRERDSLWREATLAGIFFLIHNEVVVRLVRARPDLVWLHAGAAASRGRAVLVSAQSGRGKSTVVAALCRLGWQFLSDDITPWDPQAGKVWPFPQTPMFRVNPGREVPAEGVAELGKVVADVGPAGVCREPLPVSALIFPQYTPAQAAGLVPCSPGAAALELLQNCLNFSVSRDQAFHHLCDLVKPLPAYRLRFDDGNQAARLLAEAHAGGFRGAETG
jgi:hypothetical protein